MNIISCFFSVLWLASSLWTILDGVGRFKERERHTVHLYAMSYPFHYESASRSAGMTLLAVSGRRAQSAATRPPSLSGRHRYTYHFVTTILYLSFYIYYFFFSYTSPSSSNTQRYFFLIIYLFYFILFYFMIRGVRI